MNEKLRAHVELLFQNAPKTARATELKEEILTNLNEKYNDLLTEGYTEDEAMKLVVAGIGDVNELIRGLSSDPLEPLVAQEAQRKSALVVSFSVFLYIVSIIAIAVLEPYDELYAMIGFLGIAGLSTSMLIYHFMSRPKYIRRDDTIVEDFKEWKSEKSSRKKLRNSTISLVWTLSVLIYFVVSFAFENWHISWVIFLIAVVISQIVKLIYDAKN